MQIPRFARNDRTLRRSRGGAKPAFLAATLKNDGRRGGSEELLDAGLKEVPHNQAVADAEEQPQAGAAPVGAQQVDHQQRGGGKKPQNRENQRHPPRPVLQLPQADPEPDEKRGENEQDAEKDGQGAQLVQFRQHIQKFGALGGEGAAEAARLLRERLQE